MTEFQQIVPEPCHLPTMYGEGILALLRAILETIVACQEAVLQEDAETAAVIRQAVLYALAANRTRLGPIESAADLVAMVAALINFAVQSHDEPLVERSLTGAAHDPCTFPQHVAARVVATHEDALTNWCCGLYANLQAAHPLAGQILRARLAGFDSRTIAERLALPPRLVRRVLLAIGSEHCDQRFVPGAAS